MKSRKISRMKQCRLGLARDISTLMMITNSKAQLKETNDRRHHTEEAGRELEDSLEDL
jgi:hypothetical protein